MEEIAKLFNQADMEDLSSLELDIASILLEKGYLKVEKYREEVLGEWVDGTMLVLN